MSLSFMRIDQVVMSGDGFYQSMAYHAYLNLALSNFVAQCTLCVLSIAAAYLLRWRLLRQMVAGGTKLRQLWIAGLQTMGPAVFAAACMGAFLGLGLLWGWTAHDLLVLWKVLALTLWVLLIRVAGWFFRHVLHPHEVLRIFLHMIEWSVVLVAVLTFFGFVSTSYRFHSDH